MVVTTHLSNQRVVAIKDFRNKNNVGDVASSEKHKDWQVLITTLVFCVVEGCDQTMVKN